MDRASSRDGVCGNGRRVVVSLFDESGNMGRPWAEAGYVVHCYDILNDDSSEDVGEKGGRIIYHRKDLRDDATISAIVALAPRIVFGFPPCTDMAVSGAAHFASKRAKNPRFQEEAAELARVVERIGDACGCPWFAENPVSVLATLWRKPNFRFQPYEFGGYLPEDDVHPRWPHHIKPRDAYPKQTCLWVGGGFALPEKRPVPVIAFSGQQSMPLGGKSAKTKQIRSETPRGFAKAVFEHYHRAEKMETHAIEERVEQEDEWQEPEDE